METSKSENQPRFDYHLRLKQLRKEKHFSEETLADMLHISQRAYSSIESGHTKLDADRLIEISKALDVPIYKIMGEDPQTVFNNNFNNNPHNKGTNNYQSNNDDLKSLYERLLQAKDIVIQAKDNEIKRLKEEIERLKGMK